MRFERVHTLDDRVRELAGLLAGRAHRPQREDVLEEALRAVKESAGNVETGSVVREGQPAQILIEEAAKAELLVIGSRGRGGFRDLLLGSVSQQCAHHAHCPTVIVRTGCEQPAAAE